MIRSRACRFRCAASLPATLSCGAFHTLICINARLLISRDAASTSVANKGR